MVRVPKKDDMASTALAPLKSPSADAQRRDDDRELVRLAKQENKEAFEILVKRHQGRVFAVASGILRNKEDVEDVSQQVFLKAYFSLKRFDQRAAFSTWLYKITVNECWDLLRKKKSRPLVFEAELSEEQARKYKASEDAETPAADVSDRLATQQRVNQLLGLLRARRRIIERMKRRVAEK